MAGALITLLGLLLAGIAAVVTLRSWQEERLAARWQRRLLKSSGRGRAIAATAAPGVGSTTRTLATYESDSDARIARWLPRASQLRDLLGRTGRSITLVRYVGWVAAMATATFCLLAILTHGAVVPALVVAVLVAAVVPKLVLQRMVKRRLAAFTQQFPDVIDLIVRVLRAGLPLSEALTSVGNEFPDPIGVEFRRVSGALAIGRSVEEALWEIERSIDSAELRFFIISIATQVQTGGNLGETLGNLALVLRQRAQMRMKVKAMTGEARASAGVLGSLPFAIAALMFYTNPAYIAPLFTDPRGWIMLAGGGVMLSIGVGTMAKLVSFEI